jgi:hypothetical protein
LQERDGAVEQQGDGGKEDVTAQLVRIVGGPWGEELVVAVLPVCIAREDLGHDQRAQLQELKPRAEARGGNEEGVPVATRG